MEILETRIAVVYRQDLDPFSDVQDLSTLSRFANALMASYLFDLPTGDRQYPFCSPDNFQGLYQRFDPTKEQPSIAFTFGSYFRMMVAGS